MKNKTLYKGKMVETMDATPTWEGLLPLYLDVIRNSTTVAGYQAAVGELTTMAQLADKFNQGSKKVSLQYTIDILKELVEKMTQADEMGNDKTLLDPIYGAIKSKIQLLEAINK